MAMEASPAPDIERETTSFSGSSPSLASQLERAKEDLELLAYLVSHDLKAPLRAINFAQETLSGIPAVTEHEGAGAALQKIIRESARMKVLMQGILDYLNLETFGPARAPLDMGEVVTTALSILEEKIRATSARVTCDPLPQVYGHRGRIIRLLVNLMDNALKFHSAVPAVHITAKPAAKRDFIEFSVADNGIGVDEEYHAIIFQLFQRLHPAGEYEGEGIGLALARKIAESHGGTIGVESRAGEGSRFWFTLPAIRIEQ